MSRETGPNYEMPDGFSPESFEIGSTSTSDNISEVKTVPVKTRKFRLFIPITIVAAIILIAAGIIALIRSDKINKYFDNGPEKVMITVDDLILNYYGYDGIGWLGVFVNDIKVESRLLKALGYDEDADLIEYQKEVSDICYNYEFIVCDPEDTTNSNADINGTLSNGQVVRIVMVRSDYDEIQDTTKSEERVVLEFEPIIKVVDGFEEPVEKNIFEDVIITSSGEDGNVTINVEYIGDLDKIDESDFRIMNNGRLSYGSEVKIRLRSDLIKYLYEVYGIIPDSEYIEYLIE